MIAKNSQGPDKDNFPQIIINGTPVGDQDHFSAPNKVSEIEIKYNDNSIFRISFSATTSTLAFFSDGEVERVISCNALGDKIGDCSVKNGVPNGTVWSVATGLKGLKWSSVLTYEDGKVVSEEPYDEAVLDDLLTVAAKLTAPKP